jgi:hypothetical protein
MLISTQELTVFLSGVLLDAICYSCAMAMAMDCGLCLTWWFGSFACWQICSSKNVGMQRVELDTIIYNNNNQQQKCMYWY